MTFTIIRYSIESLKIFQFQDIYYFRAKKINFLWLSILGMKVDHLESQIFQLKIIAIKFYFR